MKHLKPYKSHFKLQERKYRFKDLGWGDRVEYWVDDPRDVSRGTIIEVDDIEQLEDISLGEVLIEDEDTQEQNWVTADHIVKKGF